MKWIRWTMEVVATSCSYLVATTSLTNSCITTRPTRTMAGTSQVLLLASSTTSSSTVVLAS